MEFLFLAGATVIRCGSWKFVTWLSKWAPNKARKEKSQLHILKLFLVPGDGLGRVQLALTSLTLYSDTGDRFWSKNLVVQISCPRNKWSPRRYYIFWMSTHPTCISTLPSNGFSLFNLSFCVGPCWGLEFYFWQYVLFSGWFWPSCLSPLITWVKNMYS